MGDNDEQDQQLDDDNALMLSQITAGSLLVPDTNTRDTSQDVAEWHWQPLQLAAGVELVQQSIDSDQLIADDAVSTASHSGGKSNKLAIVRERKPARMRRYS